MVLDLRISHNRWGSIFNPSRNGHSDYPTDIVRTLNEDDPHKVLTYRVDYNNRPSHPITFMETIPNTSGCLHGEFVCLLFLQTHRETDRFLAASGVQLAQTNFHFRRTTFSSQLKSKVGHILAKAAALRIMLNIDGAPIASRSHTHPSHTQNSRLLTSSLSLGVPVPRATQCI